MNAPTSAQSRRAVTAAVDRHGRKPLLIACCIAFILVPYPLFTYLASGNATFGMLIAIQILFALLISMFSGAGPAAIAEIRGLDGRHLDAEGNRVRRAGVTN